MASTKLALSIITCLACATAACGADGDNEAATLGTNQAIPAGARVAAVTNNSRISLRGRVVSTTPRSFVLDYGSGRITVEMDDWDWFQEGRAIVPGDDVFVTGMVDRDLFEQRKIEASSVYAVRLGTYFYASGADEEDTNTTVVLGPIGTTDVSGTVTAIEGREFMIGDRDAPLRVDTAEMAENPMDEEGASQLRIGDRVYAWGRLDIDPGEANELMAQGVIQMRPDRTKKSAPAEGQAGGQGNAANAVAPQP